MLYLGRHYAILKHYGISAVVKLILRKGVADKLKEYLQKEMQTRHLESKAKNAKYGWIKT